jgi:hypothetical protein
MKMPLRCANPNTSLAVGAVLFIAGACYLYDGWEGRGRKPPLLARPFLPW